MIKKIIMCAVLCGQSFLYGLQVQQSKVACSEEKQRELYAQNERLNALIFMVAARLGRMDDMKKAIAAGIDIDMQDKEGKTALMIAAENKRIEIVKYLIESNVDLNKINKLGMTVLMREARSHSTIIIEILISSGADFSIENREDKNKIAANYAAENEWYDAYRSYLKAVDRGVANRRRYLKEQDDARLQITAAMFENENFEIAGITGIVLKYLYSPLCPNYEIKK